jgi:hypothetical protein
MRPQLKEWRDFYIESRRDELSTHEDDDDHDKGGPNDLLIILAENDQ